MDKNKKLFVRSIRTLLIPIFRRGKHGEDPSVLQKEIAGAIQSVKKCF